MIDRNDLDREIELVQDCMRTAPLDESGYLVGKLAALLWVGGMLRTDSHYEAQRIWKQMQSEGDLIHA